jgi:hypothetical protein
VRDLTFEHVRKGKGRIHIAVPTPADAPVETLCGKTFAAGDYAVTEDEADCVACRRRREDPGAVSSAFFAHGGGSQLLELALQEAARREKPSRGSEKPPPAPRPRKPEPPPPPEEVGELTTAGFTPAEGGVWRSPDGVIVRLSGEKFAELIAGGQVRVVRKGRRVTLEAGDVRLELEADSVRVKRAR